MDTEAPQVKKRKVSPAGESETLLAPVANLLIKRLSEKARLPTRGSALSAGYDLYRLVVVYLKLYRCSGDFTVLKRKLSPPMEKPLLTLNCLLQYLPVHMGELPQEVG